MSQARWVVRRPDPRKTAALRKSLGCPEAIARLLVAREVTPESAAAYLEPTLSQLHDPRLLLGMDAAVKRIRQAVDQSEPMLIYGDYDVDGTTATVLLKTAIDRIASPDTPAIVTYHVPHRLREGYGMQGARLAEAAAAGVRLVISVDTGIRAFAAAEEAKTLGLDLIVTDHHLPDGAAGIPEALAVINPAQPGCGYPNKNLCGAAVAFKLAHALLAASAVTPEQQKRLQDVLLPSFLKLVAIATIADSVALTGENRAIVALGLKALSNPIQPGLRALMQVAKIALDSPPTATEIGFRLAPRINAAGRMDIASDVVELFLTRDVERAHALAEKLDLLNQDRRASEATALAAIEMQLLTLQTAGGEYPAECVVLDHPEWHRGVLGILASRVVERTGRPALILTSELEQSHGSGRSIAGFHLLDALTAAHGSATDNGLFTRFGGHAYAVGFSLPTAKLGLLRKALAAHAAVYLTTEMMIPRVSIDAETDAGELTRDTLEWLCRMAPFGIGNAEPVLVARGLELAGAPRMLKEIHICLPLAGGLNAMGWSRREQLSWSERVREMKLQKGSKVDCVFRLRENKHPVHGCVELELIDLAESSTNFHQQAESND